MSRPRNSSPTYREAVFQMEALAAWKAGRGRSPICVHCDHPVSKTADLWDVAHVGAPHCFDGNTVGIGHHACNMDDARQVTRDFAKSNRVRRKHIGADGPGLGKCPMRAGRRSRTSKSFHHGLVARLTHAEKHARFLASRAVGADAEHAP